MNRCFLLALLFITCGDPPRESPPTGPTPAPDGPAPDIEVTAALGDAPLVGEIKLLPQGSSTGWSYSVDFDTDGPVDRSGVLERGIGFFYEFTVPGLHTIPIRFERGGETVSEDVLVAVNDPGSIEILAQRQLPNAGPVSYEGIVVDHAGSSVYAADFTADVLYRLSTADLSDLSSPLPVQGGPEGMAISPSDSLLYIIHKRGPLTVVAIPEMVIRRELNIARGFFIEVIDEFRVVISGGNFGVFDTRSGDLISTDEFARAWDITIAPDRGQVAAIGLGDRPRKTVQLYSVPELTLVREIPLPDIESAGTLEFDPAGDRLFLTSRREDGVAFLVIDTITGDLVRESPVASSFACSNLCAANPTAVSRDGRYIAFEGTVPGLVIVDTEIDAPILHTRDFIGGSVAASPTEAGVFFTLRQDGLITKLRVR